MEPLVTVIVCVYNAGRYLRPSIESVLEQTYGRLQVVVVDDGSTDGCMDAIADMRDPRMEVYRQPNSGKPVALNRALAATRGEFFALHDADDLSRPNRIERLLAVMQDNPRLAAVFSGYDLLIDGVPRAPVLNPKDEAACADDIARFSIPSQDPTVMYRTAVARQYPFAEDLPVVEGLDHILRIGEHHAMKVLGECLYSYRIHPHQITRRSPGERERLVAEVRRRACLRRGIPLEAAPAAGNGTASSNDVRENHIASHFISSVLDLRRARRRLEAFRTGLFCSRLHPLDPVYHKALVYAVAPGPIIPLLRRKGKA
ncbi:glycosyltransferase family 2 protein [bacterium]|nr:glycosyltransferase family 2 protein [bacterium]